MAEFIFKYLTKGKYHVESRATSSEEIGNDIHYGTKEQLDIHNMNHLFLLYQKEY